ncbi:MAG: aldehyde dehydrogenase family protein [Cyclobacteriaceae bacterium]
MITTINPYTKEVIANYPFLTDTELNDKLALSGRAYHSWKQTSLKERQELVLQFLEIIEQEEQELALLVTQEMGKPISEAKREVAKCVRSIRQFVEKSDEYLKEEIIKTNYAESIVIYESTGTVLGIMPWNFPLWQVIRYAIPNLLGGNTILLKHAPNTVGCGERVEELFVEAGFPKGIFQHLIIGLSQVETVIASPIVSGVTLTGSDRAGKAVAALAGKHLKKCVLELGGNDPFIVLKDADIQEAAEKAVAARMGNTGQVCIAAKRVIVEEVVLDKFTSFYLSKVSDYQSDNPINESTTLGVMAREDLGENVMKQVKQLIANGAKILFGSVEELAAHAIKPCVLQLTSEQTIDEEIFGPVGLIIPVKDEEEAIKVANDTKYGLGASLWTTNKESIQRITPQLEAGAVAVNVPVKSEVALPFGGVKQSGFGKELGEMGMKEFLNAKTTVIV